MLPLLQSKAVQEKQFVAFETNASYNCWIRINELYLPFTVDR
jgi:hypothetical protein